MDKLKTPIFFQLSKFDSIEGIFEAVATAELPDKSGEVCHYETTKPFYQKWSDGIKKASGGKSLGNIRAMHQPIAAGKVTALNFDDANKQIRITGKIIDKAEKEKMAEGVYTGVSQGGAYVEKWTEGDLTYYTAEPSEISIVDNPCLGEASFEYVKADGTTEIRKLHTAEDESAEQTKDEPVAKKSDQEVQQGWQAKDGSFHKSKAEAIKHNQLTEAAEFAKAATADVSKLIGDINSKIDDKIEDDQYWKREFSDEERAKAAESGEAMEDGSFPIKSENDLKNAIRAVGRAKDPAKAKAHIIARAKAMNLETLIPEEWQGSKKALKSKRVLKSLHDVGRAACLISELDWMHQSLEFEAAFEGDDSPAPEHLSEIIKELCAFLTSLVEEECGEVVEDHGGTGIELALEAVAGLPSDQAQAIAKYVAKAIQSSRDLPTKKMNAATSLHAALVKAGDDEGFETHQRAHGDRVRAVHKLAGSVMQHCMKAMHQMHTDDEEQAEKLMKSIGDASAHMKKAHHAGHEILQHCMKMGSKIETPEEAEDEAHKMTKMQAVNDALSTTIGGLKGQLGDLLKRIDHLERQPAVRKGVLFEIKPGHEAPSGNAPVETDMSTYDALRLPPEAERRIAFARR